MDEEKPFPIEFFVIFLAIAIANDAAQIFFLILDFTGVGVAGEAIMEPMNFLLDMFFVAVFAWRTKSLGGITVTQYIGGAAEICLVPLRVVTVLGGMLVANNPDSWLGKIATTAASVETGDVGALEGGVENTAAEEIQKEAQEKALQQRESEAAAGVTPKEGTRPSATAAQQESLENEGSDSDQEAQPEKTDPMASREEGSPIENLGEELSEESPQEIERPEPALEPQEKPRRAKVIDISTRRKPAAQEDQDDQKAAQRRS